MVSNEIQLYVCMGEFTREKGRRGIGGLRSYMYHIQSHSIALPISNTRTNSGLHIDNMTTIPHSRPELRPTFCETTDGGAQEVIVTRWKRPPSNTRLR